MPLFRTSLFSLLSSYQSTFILNLSAAQFFASSGLIRCDCEIIKPLLLTLYPLLSRVTQTSIPNMPISGSYFTPGMWICSFTPKEKFPCLSSTLSEILKSIASRAFLRNSSAFFPLRVTLHPSAFPFDAPKVVLSRAFVMTTFFSVSFSSSLFALSSFSPASPHPMLSVTFSILISLFGFIRSFQLYQRLLLSHNHQLVERNLKPLLSCMHPCPAVVFLYSINLADPSLHLAAEYHDSCPPVQLQVIYNLLLRKLKEQGISRGAFFVRQDIPSIGKIDLSLLSSQNSPVPYLYYFQLRFILPYLNKRKAVLWYGSPVFSYLWYCYDIERSNGMMYVLSLPTVNLYVPALDYFPCLCRGFGQLEYVPYQGKQRYGLFFLMRSPRHD